MFTRTSKSITNIPFYYTFIYSRCIHEEKKIAIFYARELRLFSTINGRVEMKKNKKEEKPEKLLVFSLE
jgi:hypothetical protein